MRHGKPSGEGMSHAMYTGDDAGELVTVGAGQRELREAGHHLRHLVTSSGIGDVIGDRRRRVL